MIYCLEGIVKNMTYCLEGIESNSLLFLRKKDLRKKDI